MKRLPRSFQFVFIGLIALTIPLLYQNCGQVKDSRNLSSEEPEESNAPEISIEIHNGDGVLIANGASLCGPDESEDNSESTDSNNDELNKVTTDESMDGSNELSEPTRTAHISVTLPSSVSSYLCRKTLPLADEEFWSCDEARSLDGVSSGSFSEGDEESSSDSTISTASNVIVTDSTTSTTIDTTTTTMTETSTKQVTLSYENLSDGTYEIEIYAEGTDENGTAWTSSVLPVSFTVEDCQNSEGTEDSEETTSTTLEETTTTQQ